MRVANLLLLLSCFLCNVYCNVLGRSDDATTVELVFVVFRHGERVPETNEQYPTDTYNMSYFYPMTYGEITNGGKRRQYQLGKKLRNKYNEFLAPLYKLDEVIMYTTNWDRTKMSALLTLAGLFPPVSSQIWNDELKWLPIPYHYETSEHDHLIQRPDPYCPRYRKELRKVFASETVKNITKRYQDVFNYVSTHSGRNVFDYHEMLRVLQNIQSKVSMNLTIPEWARKIYPEPFHTVASYQCVFENFNPLLRRLNGGHIIQKFVEIAQRKINSTLVPPTRKMLLYSGHENNIVNILSVLDLYEQHIPPYCSAVMLELHRKTATNEYGFKVFYENDTYSQGSHELVIPGCSKFCEFHKFIDLTKHVLPVNYTAECESDVYLD